MNSILLIVNLANPRTGNASNSLLPWLQRQLQKCSRDHQHCNPVAQPCPSTLPPPVLSSDFAIPNEAGSALPTRVLDLGQPGDSTVKLLETRNAMTGHYICLSHCWGQKQPMVTKKNNIGAWKKGIPWTLIPRTFQDAIALTRDLRIRYLWIDSLCIIQDDSKDWQQQAGKMAEIYKNSLITLAATSSPDCDGGLFHDFPPRSEIHTLRGLDSSGNNLDVYVQKKMLHWTDFGDATDINLTKDFPLVTRAWAFQERLLAPRIVHFCSEELVWECNEEWVCQCGSFRDFTNPKKAHANMSWRQHVQTSRSAPPSKSTEQSEAPDQVFRLDSMREGWHETVQAYTNLEITFDSDRLPALAGLAEELQRFRKDRYLAGLWEDDLLHSLGWQIWSPFTKRKPLAPRPKMHHPPTWSWASVNQEITFSGSPLSHILSAVDEVDFPPLVDHAKPNGEVASRLSHFLSVVDKVDCPPLDHANPKGEVAHGHLVMRGHLTDGTLDYDDDDKTFKARLYGKGWMEIFGSEFYPDYDFAFPGPDQLKNGQELHCLTVSLRGNGLVVLVLICVDENMNHYKRIGILTGALDASRTAKLLPQWQFREAELEESALGDTKIENSVVPSSSPTAETDGKDLDFLVQGVRLVTKKSWTAFIKTFDRDKVNDILPWERAADWPYVLVKMTPDRARKVVSPGVIRNVKPIPLPGSRRQERKRFLTAKDARRKERGESHVRYLGETIIII
ncbi:uncharacterized protein PAC_01089 [Phialocephala subalpina]|uniref:Heterokaryon incompatibility domain-containing protein n=1 Tax=Phialocephala subalpina TaxID=576137 RepID=A0A1L7WEM8_9HELO|nr:uncharacterized protein PAC_01089 [Phialocephala subalpina]